MLLQKKAPEGLHEKLEELRELAKGDMGEMDSNAHGVCPEIRPHNPAKDSMARYAKCPNCGTQWTGDISKCPVCEQPEYSLDRVTELQEELLREAQKTNHFDPHFLDCGQDDGY